MFTSTSELYIVYMCASLFSMPGTLHEYISRKKCYSRLSVITRATPGPSSYSMRSSVCATQSEIMLGIVRAVQKSPVIHQALCFAPWSQPSLDPVSNHEFTCRCNLMNHIQKVILRHMPTLELLQSSVQRFLEEQQQHQTSRSSPTVFRSLHFFSHFEC